MVTGRVQGVGFRAHAQREALHLGLRGEVWNRRDGAVEGFVAGGQEDVARFLEALRKGPGQPQLVLTEACEADIGIGFVIGGSR